MKNILNHQNQQNIQRQNLTARNSSSHPSHETQQQPYKPTIKVGYKNEAPLLTNRNQSKQIRRYKKPVMIVKQPPRQQQGLKRVLGNSHQISSGTFVDSEYIIRGKQNNIGHMYRRKGVNQVHEKIYGGKQVDRELKQQFLVRSKSAFLRSDSTCKNVQRTSNGGMEKRPWGQNNCLMKDILQYRNAGEYKDRCLAEKCTNQKATSRCLKFQDLHDYDFRKSKPQIR